MSAEACWIKKSILIFEADSGVGFLKFGTGLSPSVTTLGGKYCLTSLTEQYDLGIRFLQFLAVNIETTERVTQEAVRIVLSVLRKHRRMWVVDVCPICKKFTLNPQHFTVDHNDILSTYVTSVTSEFNNLWTDTHDPDLAPPALPSSGLAAEAFIRMYNDVGAGTSVSNLTTTSRNNILRMRADNVEPVRLLYDVICNDIKGSDDATNRQLFRNGTITIRAKELVRQLYFGPDNVPTTAY